MNRIKVDIDLGQVALVALTACFVVLKATGYIDWNWWWVFAPMWGPLAIWLLLVAGISIMAALAALVAAWLDK